MKNEYRAFRKKILTQAFVCFILMSAVWYGLFSLAADGLPGTLLKRAAVWVLVSVRGMKHSEAASLCGSLAGKGHLCLGLLGCAASFLILFLIAVNRMTRYLNGISMALDGIEHAPEEPVVLPEELLSVTGQLERLKSELLRREKEAAVSEQKKNELVAYLAHDLRTPLTSVVAYLTMLENQQDMGQEEREKYTHITLEKALRLEELINEFFDITKFNLQDFVLEKQEVDLAIFLEQIADENYGMLQKKGMTCAVDAQDGLLIEGDPDKLARVFENLLRNAVAYGSENTQILIQARGGHGRTTIVFTNEGPQIPQKKLEMIFERFYRADDSRSSKTGGSGLGLAIAKQIVELHGGTITAASDQKNTRFIVTFPSVSHESRKKRR